MKMNCIAFLYNSLPLNESLNDVQDFPITNFNRLPIKQCIFKWLTKGVHWVAGRFFRSFALQLFKVWQLKYTKCLTFRNTHKACSTCNSFYDFAKDLLYIKWFLCLSLLLVAAEYLSSCVKMACCMGLENVIVIFHTKIQLDRNCNKLCLKLWVILIFCLPYIATFFMCILHFNNVNGCDSVR
jgi:hypothetical protein